jgi:hypothetical protein
MPRHPRGVSFSMRQQEFFSKAERENIKKNLKAY